MFCKNCGKKIEDDAKFCPQCETATAGTKDEVVSESTETEVSRDSQKINRVHGDESIKKLKSALSDVIAASRATQSAADAVAGDESKIVIVDTVMKFLVLVAFLFFAVGGVYCMLTLAIGTGLLALATAVALFFVNNAFAHGYIIDTIDGAFSFAAVKVYKQAGFNLVEFIKTYLFGGSVPLSEIKRIEIENGVHWNSQKQEYSATKKLKVYGTFGHLGFYFGSHEKLTEVALALSQACGLNESEQMSEEEE